MKVPEAKNFVRTVAMESTRKSLDRKFDQILCSGQEQNGHKELFVRVMVHETMRKSHRDDFRKQSHCQGRADKCYRSARIGQKQRQITGVDCVRAENDERQKQISDEQFVLEYIFERVASGSFILLF